MEKVKDDLFNEENVPESNWFKFSKVGERVSGEVVNIYEKAGTGDFEDQKVFELMQANGELISVGIKKSNVYVIQRTNKVEAGDVLGFEFTKEIPAKVKGHHPAKSITPFVKYTDAGNIVREAKKDF
jgi:hypothetical protein